MAIAFKNISPCHFECDGDVSPMMKYFGMPRDLIEGDQINVTSRDL
jgi:hypothetical protein